MKKLLFFLLLLMTVSLCAQEKTAQHKRGIRTKLIVNDSVAKKLLAFKDSIERRLPAPDSIQIRKSLERGFQEIIKVQDENRRKQKNAAYIRIGVGAAFLALLIAGLLRKRKAKQGSA